MAPNRSASGLRRFFRFCSALGPRTHSRTPPPCPKEFQAPWQSSAALWPQSPLILDRCAHSRNQFFEALNGALKVVDIFLQQSKEFRVGSGHKTPPDPSSNPLRRKQFSCQATRDLGTRLSNAVFSES